MSHTDSCIVHKNVAFDALVLQILEDLINFLLLGDVASLSYDITAWVVLAKVALDML